MRSMNGKAERSHTKAKGSYRLSFLLRVWNTDELGGNNWQASLEDPKTGDRIGFTSIEELFAYILNLTSLSFY